MTSPSLPISVIVQFDNYKGPSFVDTLPNIVPICPITITADTFNGYYERQQIPLKLSWDIIETDNSLFFYKRLTALFC